jgi:hypothetical protein
MRRHSNLAWQVSSLSVPLRDVNSGDELMLHFGLFLFTIQTVC